MSQSQQPPPATGQPQGPPPNSPAHNIRHGPPQPIGSGVPRRAGPPAPAQNGHPQRPAQTYPQQPIPRSSPPVENSESDSLLQEVRFLRHSLEQQENERHRMEGALHRQAAALQEERQRVQQEMHNIATRNAQRARVPVAPPVQNLPPSLISPPPPPFLSEGPTQNVAAEAARASGT